MNQLVNQLDVVKCNKNELNKGLKTQYHTLNKVMRSDIFLNRKCVLIIMIMAFCSSLIYKCE